MVRPGILILLLAACNLVTSGLGAAEPASDAAALDFFEKRVRPVLVAQCQKCHGPEKQEQGLRVDSLAALVAGGETGPAVVPGKPEQSLLVGAINHGEIYQMPPKAKLPAAVIADLTAWVKMGAPWPAATAASVAPPKVAAERPHFTAEERAFWAFTPPVPGTVPAVRNSAWCRSPIDNFVLAGLEAKNLAPAPPADRRTLIRRLSFDLLGLPPTPPEVEAFVADESPYAIARVVDRLLASPRYGERWGRHWLDVARYADSNGMDENVAYANAYRYRDYVIAAFNKDKPYDQFVREQIAGDLLPDPHSAAVTAERLTATGFLVIGPKMLAEDDPLKMEMDIVDEQLDTVGRTFMGLTLGCARCHDHKFDPIPTADYYSLAAIFKSTKTMENFKVVAMWNETPIASPEFIARHQQSLASSQAKKKAAEEFAGQAREQFVEAATKRAADYLAAATLLARQEQLRPRMNEATTAALPGVIVLEAEKYDRGNVKRDFTDYGDKIGVVYNAGELPNVAEFDLQVDQATTYQLEIRLAAVEARPIQVILDGKLLKEGAAAQVTGTWQPDTQAWSAECVVTLPAGKHVLRLERAGPFPHIDKLALVPRADIQGEAAVPQTLMQVATERDLQAVFLEQWVKYVKQAAGPLTVDELPRIVQDPQGPFALPKDHEQYLPADVKAELARLRSEATAAEKAVPPLPTAMSASEGKIANLKIHLRGNYLTQDREVPRQFLQIIAGEQQTPIDDRQSGRLPLVEWLTSPQHPLTSRVMVNRVWHWHFGQGIVRSPDNFGRLGELPDNQPLLDWLAASFVQQGWSLKRLHRDILLSSTYQMSTAFDERAAAADPENRLHWRAERRRLEAEALRDGILAVCGELDESMGGTLLTVENHKYVTSTASEKFDPYHVARRSVYLPVTRSSVYDLFQAFDFADPSTANGQRATTTIAPQALALMNSRLIEDQTRSWAQQLIADGALDDAARVRRMYERAFSRPPIHSEIDRALAFIRRVETSSAAQQQSPEAGRQQAWQSLARVLLASSEFVYVE